MTRCWPLFLSALLAGCSSASSPFINSNIPERAQTADYTVDARIAGKYGTKGEVAWVVDPDHRHRPHIYSLGEQLVEFEAGVTTAAARRKTKL